MNYIKKTWLPIALCLLLTACGADAPAVSTNPPEEPPVETTLETVADEEPTQPAKIRLNGEVIPWDQFPIPEAEVFGLTGEDASLYEAAVSQFNREETPGYFTSDGINTEIRFSEMGVRFIAVNDGVDSEDRSSNDFTPFRNIINETFP